MLVSDLEKRRADQRQPRNVLILVLVDVGLGHEMISKVVESITCLNPCFSGCWSRTGCKEGCEGFCQGVLILVLVDVGLGHPCLSHRLAAL